MPAAAKTRTKPVASVAIAPNHPSVPAAPKRPDSKAVHAIIDELFVALKPFGACESTKVVTLLRKLKSAT